MATKIGTISNALLRIGDDTINSLDEGSQRAKVAANLYDNIYESELISHTWSWSRKIQALNLTTDVPPTDEWRFIYQIPTDLIQVFRIYPGSDYEIYGDKIYSNTSNLALDYYARVSESVWPDYFATLMELALAKAFAIPIRENTDMAQVMNQEYLAQGQKARAVESKQRIQRPIQSRPLIEARY
jgi:hypothetical protein